MNFNVLHWSYRDLKVFPPEVQNASEFVEEIYLKENFIEMLPSWLFQMTNLKFIHLSGNLIDEIPQDINCLVNLEFLDVSKNRLKELPLTIGSLSKLKCLNVGENEISSIPRQVGFLKCLEALDVSKNLLTTVPNELGNCLNLLEINLRGNHLLAEIPARVYALCKLIYFDVNNCALSYLPYVVGARMVHVRAFDNQKLTHIPIVYEKFLQPWMEPLPIYCPLLNIQRDYLVKVFSQEENRWFNLPRGLVEVHKRTTRTSFSLFELCVRKIYTNFWGPILDQLLEEFVPRLILYYIKMGPIGHCGNGYCSNPIFKDSYFMLMKKIQNPSGVVFSAIFCSKDCADFWMSKFRNMYREIDWTVY
ncbi:Leucine-rich repeat [Sergentomyia squamirostris]